MAKYEVITSGAVGFYRGDIVTDEDLEPVGGAKRLLDMDPPGIRKVDSSTPTREDVPPSDLTDGDGNAVTRDGVNIAPGAPPQKTDDAATKKAKASGQDALSAP